MAKAEILKLISLAVDIEQALAKLYAALAGRADDPELRKFWLRMAADEHNHSASLQMQERLLRKSEIAVRPTLTLDEVKTNYHALLSGIGELLQQPKPAAATVDACIDFESLARVVHTDTLLRVDDAATRALFERLAKEDATHVERLQKLRTTLAPT